MKKVIERIVKSEGAPLENDLWLDPKTNELKHYENEEWKTIAGGESSGGGSTPSDSGCNCPGVRFVNVGFDEFDMLYITDDDVTARDVVDFLERGGMVYLVITQDGFTKKYIIQDYAATPFGVILDYTDGSLYEFVSEYTVFGTVDNYGTFMPSSDEPLSWLGAKNSYQDIDIYLSWQANGVTVSKPIVGYSADFHYLYTDEIDSGQDNYVVWSKPEGPGPIHS